MVQGDCEAGLTRRFALGRCPVLRDLWRHFDRGIFVHRRLTLHKI